MKFIIMLTVVLSAFFMFSCGDGDSDTGGGVSQSEFYKTVVVQTCEKGFQCDIEMLKYGKTDVNECKDLTSDDKCSHDFNGAKGKECNECVKALTCTEYAEGGGIADKCPVCSEVCTVKM